jgi:uncharacterized SAM-binding protein YcdF (DUF218 family)
MSDRGKHESATPIYESVEARASARRPRISWIEHSVTGALTGILLWYLTDQLGVWHVFGISSEAGLVPFAITGAAISFTRLRRLPIWASLALVTLILLVSYTGIIAAPARQFIRADPVPASADAVVALSAGVSADGYLPQQGLDRLIKAVELVKSGVAPVLVVTREERRIDGGKTATSADQQRIIALAGIPHILSTVAVKSTHDEAMQIARLATNHGWKRIVLVTSPFHSRRACGTFEKAGLIISCVPSDSRDVAIRNLKFPSDRIQAFRMWLYETAGTLRYRQLDWL